MTEANNEGAKAGRPASRRSPAHHWTLVWAAVLALGLAVERSAAGHREHEERDIWFVHATDPHLFLKRVQLDETKTDSKKAKEELDWYIRVRERQEQLNRDALSQMLARIGLLPTDGGRPEFLVLTGDLGIDPCEIFDVEHQPKTPSLEQCLKDFKPEERKTQIKQIADVLSKSPVRDIYLVAGNNDIANESASDQALEYFNKFIDEVQAKLDPDKVKLHNLTRGYLSSETPATCYADIPHTNYRLIGFPSYSFKTEDRGQERQMKVFRQLLDEAKDKKVLVISHTPGMEDPHALAKARYKDPTPAPGSSPTPTETPGPEEAPAETSVVPAATVTPTQTPTPEEKAAAASPADKKKKEAETKAKKAEEARAATSETDREAEPKSSKSSASTWKVNAKVLNSWKEAVSSESVMAVFAGHLHDSHKEIYERPYSWSNGSEHRPAFRKLFLAPPLAVKKQDTSPIQARGFSLVHLSSDRVASRLFWYDSETGDFTPQPKAKHHRRQHGFWEPLCNRLHTSVKWLWELGDDHNSKALDRMAMLLIALLATFLTVVAIWKIPPVDDPLPGEPGKPKPPIEPSPFSGNFAGLIIAGLGGLAATTVLKSLDGKPSAGDKEFYIVWFVISFFVLLILSAVLRGLVEALRARFAIIHYPLPRYGTPPRGLEGKRTKNYPLWPGKLWRWLIYRFHAALHWLSSLRVPLLTFADTFTNLIQGKNYTITQAFSDKIVDQQRNVLHVANAIRQQLHQVIVQKLLEPTPKGGATEESQARNRKREVCPDDVRVSISVLSLDQNSVFYISRAARSSRQPFMKRSLAWVSVFAGRIRWYKKSYLDDEALFKAIIVLDNSEKTIADDQPIIYLRSHYQPRGGADYEAWVMFPVPWPRQRGLEDSSYVKGAIHISFRHEEHFDQLWPFDCTPDEVRKKITEQVDDKIKKAKDADIEAKIKTSSSTCDPVIEHYRYQNEERMLKDWCTEPEVRATLSTAIKVLGEVLRGFNEHIYKCIGKSEQAD